MILKTILKRTERKKSLNNMSNSHYTLQTHMWKPIFNDETLVCIISWENIIIFKKINLLI